MFSTAEFKWDMREYLAKFQKPGYKEAPCNLFNDLDSCLKLDIESIHKHKKSGKRDFVWWCLQILRRKGGAYLFEVHDEHVAYRIYKLLNHNLLIMPDGSKMNEKQRHAILDHGEFNYKHGWWGGEKLRLSNHRHV